MLLQHLYNKSHLFFLTFSLIFVLEIVRSDYSLFMINNSSGTVFQLVLQNRGSSN